MIIAFPSRCEDSLVDRRGAFSLAELLVVIGIVSIVISMLLPALAKAKRDADAVVCENNLRQIGIALNIYADHNGEHFPTWSHWEVFPNGVSPEDDGPELGWTEQIMPEFVPPTSPAYRCPAFIAEARINYFLEARWLYVHSPALACLNRSEIRMSSAFVLAGDCTAREMYCPPFGVNFRHPTSSDCDKSDEGYKALVFRGEPGGLNMHPGGNNVLFADRHVEPMIQFDPSRMTYSPHQMQDWEHVTPD